MQAEITVFSKMRLHMFGDHISYFIPYILSSAYLFLPALPADTFYQEVQVFLSTSILTRANVFLKIKSVVWNVRN